MVDSELQELYLAVAPEEEQEDHLIDHLKKLKEEFDEIKEGNLSLGEKLEAIESLIKDTEKKLLDGIKDSITRSESRYNRKLRDIETNVDADRDGAIFRNERVETELKAAIGKR